MILTVTILVRPDKSHDDDLEELRSRASEREAMLGERAAEVARVRSELDAFRIEYRQRVGLLHEQLDELELAIAEAEQLFLGELSKRANDRTRTVSESSAGARSAPPPRYTSDTVRKLFRDVAKAIHPDLASDESTRDRRHTLMAEADRA